MSFCSRKICIVNLDISIVIDSDRGHFKFFLSVFFFNLSFWLFRPNLLELALSRPHFLSKCSFREVSNIFFLLFRMKISRFGKFWKTIKQKYKNRTLVNCTFIIHENGNKTSIQPVLKLNSTPFMFNNNFCDMSIKKSYIRRGSGGMGESS